jgi:hypothetical protein
VSVPARGTRLGEIFGENSRIVAQSTGGDILGYFCLKQCFYIFTIISSFKAWFVEAILRVQKGLDVDALEFQI